MKIVIPGGTGQVGRVLCRAFASAGDEVVVLSRKVDPRSSCRCVLGDGESVGDWARELQDPAAVINLAGRSVNCPLCAISQVTTPISVTPRALARWFSAQQRGNRLNGLLIRTRHHRAEARS